MEQPTRTWEQCADPCSDGCCQLVDELEAYIEWLSKQVHSHTGRNLEEMLDERD